MKVFFSALGWGLGHTTRIIPIVEKYKKEGHQILIGCSEIQKKIYLQHFNEDDEFVNFCSISPLLFKNGRQIIPWIIFAVRFIFFTWHEKRKINQLQHRFNFDLIISDNRYGVRSKNCKNILITHQLNLILPRPLKYFSRVANFWVHRQINNFDSCWVPDTEGENSLAGLLSKSFKNPKPNIQYIGHLSRLSIVKETPVEKKDIVVLISGPEKQRSVFEELVTSELMKIKEKYSYIILNGKTSGNENLNTFVINNIEPGKLKYLLVNAKYIICRSGYSSMMDLVCLKKTAFLIPTPGQSEQEYLAAYNQTKGLFLSGQQNSFNLIEVLAQSDQFQY